MGHRLLVHSCPEEDLVAVGEGNRQVPQVVAQHMNLLDFGTSETILLVSWTPDIAEAHAVSAEDIRDIPLGHHFRDERQRVVHHPNSGINPKPLLDLAGFALSSSDPPTSLSSDMAFERSRGVTEMLLHTMSKGFVSLAKGNGLMTIMSALNTGFCNVF
eukprot:CAMPEP_0184329642 /NCGR_PEP_ID=MMETSP1049-20130417/144260_1 /TAXON_ID=77928 /ORGANISM="Proteomonas sulcata, Strain CCMP704" /LENGTH=158 /DNA_ID=CAMNT_0026652025 /DNA_START=527 /DNA_END=1004 /DNA_ORIENTATION=+